MPLISHTLLIPFADYFKGRSIQIFQSSYTILWWSWRPNGDSTRHKQQSVRIFSTSWLLTQPAEDLMNHAISDVNSSEIHGTSATRKATSEMKRCLHYRGTELNVIGYRNRTVMCQGKFPIILRAKQIAIGKFRYKIDRSCAVRSTYPDRTWYISVLPADALILQGKRSFKFRSCIVHSSVGQFPRPKGRTCNNCTTDIMATASSCFCFSENATSRSLGMDGAPSTSLLLDLLHFI